MAGDSVHQFMPTGGYGMNTGVGDAVDLGWKLAAVIHGWGGPALLRSYEEERRPIAIPNRAASRRHLDVNRSAEHPGGKGCVSTCIVRVAPAQLKKQQNSNNQSL